MAGLSGLGAWHVHNRIKREQHLWLYTFVDYLLSQKQINIRPQMKQSWFYFLLLLCSFPKDRAWARKSSYSLYISNHISLLRSVTVSTFVEIFNYKMKLDIHEMVKANWICCPMRTKGLLASFSQVFFWNYKGLHSKSIERKKQNMFPFLYWEISCMVGFLFQIWWMKYWKIN